MSYYYPSSYYGSSNVMKYRINKSLEKYMPQNQRAAGKCNTEISAQINAHKPKLVLDDNVNTTTLKKIGIGIGAAVLAYCSKNIIGACIGGLKCGGAAFKNFLSKHTKGSIHEALGGIYHAVAGTGKILTAPARGFAKLFKH